MFIEKLAVVCSRQALTVLSWPLLKQGGLMTFDDYEWQQDPNVLRRPKPAIDAFLTVYKTRYRLVHKGYQVTVEKLEG
jgi:hypothetical protein